MPELAEMSDAELSARLRSARHDLRTGAFHEAWKGFEFLLPRAANDVSVVQTTAALRMAHGKEDEARALIKWFFTEHPIVAHPIDGVPERPCAIIMRGQNATFPQIVINAGKKYSVVMRGGHFTTKYLLARDELAQLRYTIVGDTPVQPDKLPDHDLLINTIADPDAEAPALRSLQDFLDTGSYEKPVINHPDRVFRTTRDANYQRFRDTPGVTFPHTERFVFSGANADAVAAKINAAGFTMPFILRRTATQTGRTVRLITDRAALKAYVGDGLSGDFYAIAYREILWQNEFFRKLRLFSIDGTYYPVVCHLDRTWNVHGANRREVMKTRDDLMAEEQRFLADWRAYVGPACAAALDHVARATDLEFWGVDFTVDHDGMLFIYELNPSMRHSYVHSEHFPYKQPVDEAITNAFTAMVRRRLPGGNGSQPKPT